MVREKFVKPEQRDGASNDCVEICDGPAVPPWVDVTHSFYGFMETQHKKCSHMCFVLVHNCSQVSGNFNRVLSTTFYQPGCNPVVLGLYFWLFDGGLFSDPHQAVH